MRKQNASSKQRLRVHLTQAAMCIVVVSCLGSTACTLTAGTESSEANSETGPLSTKPVNVVYPITRRDNTMSMDAGQPGDKTEDPYQWLENRESAETNTWLSAQTSLTKSWFDALTYRDGIEATLNKVGDRRIVRQPSWVSNRWFYEASLSRS